MAGIRESSAFEDALDGARANRYKTAQKKMRNAQRKYSKILRNRNSYRGISSSPSLRDKVQARPLLTHLPTSATRTFFAGPSHPHFPLYTNTTFLLSQAKFAGKGLYLGAFFNLNLLI